MKTYFAGIDVGSTMTKVVIIEDGITVSVIGPTGAEHRKLANKVMEEALIKSNISLDSIEYIISTGYGRINVPFSDKQFTEITCHAKGIIHLFPKAKTIIDIGGQDVKGIKIDSNGKVKDFVMNDKCAAGTGRFIEVMAHTLGVNLKEVGEISLQSRNPAKISNICTIWAQQEVVAGLSEGIPVADLLAGIHQSLGDRIVRLVSRLKIEDEVIVTGGGGKNKALTKAISNIIGHEIKVPPEPLITGALGAALIGKEITEEAKKNLVTLKKKNRILEEIKV